MAESEDDDGDDEDQVDEVIHDEEQASSVSHLLSTIDMYYRVMVKTMKEIATM